MQKYFTRIFYTVLILASACANSLHAQDEKEGADTVNISMRIYCWAASNAISMPNLQTGVITRVSVDKGLDPLIWYKADGAWRSIRVPSGSQTGKINYKGPSPIVFYRKTGNGNADSDFDEIGKLSVPKDSGELLVLMFRNVSSARFYPVNISPDKIPEGKIAVMNMTSQNMALSLSGDARALKGGSYMIFSPLGKIENSTHVIIAQYIKKKWTPVYENKMSIPSDKRSLVLIYDPYNKGTPKFSIEVLSF